VSYILGKFVPKISSIANATRVMLVPVRVPASVYHLPFIVYVPSERDPLLKRTPTDPYLLIENFLFITGESTLSILIAKYP